MPYFAPVVAVLAIGCIGGPALAQQPPHAWLFGTWTGGLFPVAPNITAQACLAQPVVVFTRDVVLRATLTELTYTQRLIETARTNPGVTEFRFVKLPADPEPSLLGTTGLAKPGGFGCESADVLHVQKRSENEISFPGCTEFPNPLVRCPTR